ncbi:MAG: hypothetical protein IT370_29470 [Deltaproteobacteria bacterium]|nr:hypothetical protein [Deltaproteobacteria bacterium]
MSDGGDPGPGPGPGPGRPSFPSLGGVARGALSRPSWWGVDRVVLERKVLAIAPQFMVFDAEGALLLFCQHKLLTLKEDLRVYADETRKTELLTIKARQIIDFSAAYDVVDTRTGDKVGVLRRRGLKSLVRDEWQLCDADDRPFGKLQETGAALLRRLLPIPQRFQLQLGDEVVGVIKQSWNPFVFKAEMDLSLDTMGRLDRRLALAMGLLLMAIDRRQTSI